MKAKTKKKTAKKVVQRGCYRVAYKLFVRANAKFPLGSCVPVVRRPVSGGSAGWDVFNFVHERGALSAQKRVAKALKLKTKIVEV